MHDWFSITCQPLVIDGMEFLLFFFEKDHGLSSIFHFMTNGLFRLSIFIAYHQLLRERLEKESRKINKIPSSQNFRIKKITLSSDYIIQNEARYHNDILLNIQTEAKYKFMLVILQADHL